MCAAPLISCFGACTSWLTDPANCGGCGAVCGPNRACVSGVCTPLKCSASNAISIASTAFATISSGGTDPFGPSRLNDGTLESGDCAVYAWVLSSSPPSGDWITYTWAVAKTVTNMHIDTRSAAPNACSELGRTLSGATVQWWTGSVWVTDGTVSGKTDDWDYTFTTPVTTTKVRLYGVYGDAGVNPVIFEWQVAGCN